MPAKGAGSKRWVYGVLALVAIILAGGPRARAVTEDLPDSIAAIGDSITQAANASPPLIGPSNPQHSWSTGTAADGVTSHYERIFERNAAVAGRNFNDSVSGARMRDAPAQAARAVQQGAEYVTVLMGGNDVCASSKETMTSLAAFESAFRQAMDILVTGLPGTKIYVVSVPDVYQLWNVHRSNLLALAVWDSFKICQSMLAPSNTEADRQQVRTRNMDYNAVLKRVCGEYPNCRHDGGRVFDYRFTPADVSTVDYFHPSVTGQQNLAEISWRGGYWPDA